MLFEQFHQDSVCMQELFALISDLIGLFCGTKEIITETPNEHQ